MVNGGNKAFIATRTREIPVAISGLDPTDTQQFLGGVERVVHLSMVQRIKMALEGSRLTEAGLDSPKVTDRGLVEALA